MKRLITLVAVLFLCSFANAVVFDLGSFEEGTLMTMVCPITGHFQEATVTIGFSIRLQGHMRETIRKESSFMLIRVGSSENGFHSAAVT